MPRNYSTKTLYVAVDDAEIWEQARIFCFNNRVSQSRLAADAIRWYLERLTTQGK